MTIDEILRHFDGVKGGHGHYMAKCPAHMDADPSLSIGLGRDGRVLIHCFAGCRTEDVLNAVGLSKRDLFADDWRGGAPLPEFEPIQTGNQEWTEAEYIYPGGNLKKVKKRSANGKKRMYWMRRTGDGWTPAHGDVEKLLYTRGPLDSPVFLVEGEKDVDTLHALGFSAASLPDGANSKWYDHYGVALAGKDVFLIQDNDKPGKAFAARIAGELLQEARSVRVLDLAQAWPELPEHGDVTDLLDYMGKEAGCDALAALMHSAQPWTAETAAERDEFLSLFSPLTQFQEEEASWLVPGWIPEGQITLIAADGGTGKTTLWINIVAALSSGKPCILDPPGYVRAPAKVAFCTTEDSVRKKLLKKLRQAGANLANVTAMDMAADKSGALRRFKFGSVEMERFVKYFHPVACVFDPVQGFVPPEINMGSRNAMRDCMAPLITLGEENGTTFLVICHTNKRKGAYGRDRIADSADLWDISRSVIMAGYTEDQGVRYLSNEKNNYAELQETVLFSIDSRGQIVKEGTSWKRDKDFVQDAARAASAPQREGCKEFLLQTIEEAGGGMPTADLDAKAKQAGYSFTAIKRAKSDLKKEFRVSYFQTGSTRNKDNAWHIKLEHGFEPVELPDNTPVPFAPPSDI